MKYVNSLLVIQNFITARKATTFLDILKAFLDRHFMSESNRKVNRNIYHADTCDKIRLIGPKSDQLGNIHQCLLEES